MVYSMAMETFLKDLPVAHRGLHGEGVPENSLAAFEAARKAGYAIETDVRFTKDGQLAVFHDDSLFRMTKDPRNVNELPMSEIKELFLQDTAEKIPTVRELLSCVDGRVPLLIEIKNMAGVKPQHIARALSDALEGYTGEYAVQSFNPLYVRAYKKLHPEIACGILGTRDTEGTGGLQGYIVRHYALNFLVKPDFLSYRLHDTCRAFRRFKKAKLVWVVRSPEDEKIARKSADNIIFEGYRPSLAEFYTPSAGSVDGFSTFVEP